MLRLLLFHCNKEILYYLYFIIVLLYMQKTNKKASILIWSIFLSLIVSLSFVFVSTKINQNILSNISLEDFFSKSNIINDYVNEGLVWNIWDNEIVKKEFSSFTLDNWKSLNLLFSWIEDFSWSINLIEWGPLYYELISYSWADSSKEYSLSSSWILTDSTIKNFTWYLNNSYDKASLTLENLWWLATFRINTIKSYEWAWNINKFKLTKNIWWKEVEKSIIEN